MRNLFAVTTFLAFAVIGTTLTAQSYRTENSPPLPEASRWEDRASITTDVIDGRLSLLEAAAAFRDLNHQAPTVAQAVPQAYPGRTEGESACQQVLAFVRVELEGRATDSDGQKAGASSTDPESVVLSRLQTELKAAKGKDGKVRLPEDVH
jgi:hypothetical protein